MPDRGEAPEVDLLTRVYVAEQEVNRLREFRHTYQSDKMAFLLKLEQFESRLAQLKADIIQGTSRDDQLHRDVADLHRELEEHQRQIGLKTAEYDKERGVIGGIVKPLLIALLLGIGGAVVVLIARLWAMYGDK